MNRPAVTRAQIRRLVETAEAMGKTVYALETKPDGTVNVLLTEPSAPASESESGWEAYDRRHGHG